MNLVTKLSKGSKSVKTWLVLLKVVITILAFYLAFRMVDRQDLKQAFKNVDKILFTAALLLYLLSQALSSERLRLFISKFAGGHNISAFWNGKLYLIGMAYNLFLPGGIGGDAYKLILYDKKLSAGKRRLLVPLILDRLTGAIAIVLGLAAIALYHQEPFSRYMGLFWWLPALIIFAGGFYLVKSKYKRFKSIYFPATAMSLIIQMMQVGSMLLLTYAVGMNDLGSTIAVVFLLSSLATAIPVFLGGLGAREVVFAMCAVPFSYSASDAVTASLLFSGIIIITSVPGLLLSFKKS
jgi:glycosyltransferase 2 family protein